MAAPGVPRRLFHLALAVFGRLPGPVRRALVRAGTPGYTVGAVCALEHDGRLLMLRQPHRRGWSLPGGLLNRGESADAAVRRELMEEIGVRVEVGLPLASTVVPGPRRIDMLYRVRVERPPQVRLGGEAVSCDWLRPQDIVDRDGPTADILALLAQASHRDAYDGRVLP